MSKGEPYPKIADVAPQPGRRLLVRFRNGAMRLYDCSPLLRKPVFEPLRDEAFFKMVHADPHGYGVIWTDELDLAESEIRLHGRPTSTASMGCESGATTPQAGRRSAPKKRRGAAKYPTARKRRA